MRTNWNGYEIEAVFKGTKNSSWDNDSTDRHYRVTITNSDDESISFNFWTSKAKPEITEEKDLIEAAECFFTDAEYGAPTFDEFCREVGYGMPKGLYHTWKVCRKARQKAKRICGDKWQDVAYALREREGV